MQLINHSRNKDGLMEADWPGRRGYAVHSGTAELLSRLDFRHLSSHISQRKPGYYLILLRNELRHRSLRVKPALNE
jgi:hypothetical protein